jgi:hypothetical protein
VREIDGVEGSGSDALAEADHDEGVSEVVVGATPVKNRAENSRQLYAQDFVQDLENVGG